MMFYAQSTTRGDIGAKQNVFLTQVQILIHYTFHRYSFGENEVEGRQKLGWYRSPVSRHSIQNYILTDPL